MEGKPYGFETFLFGWIDTENKNFPDVASPEMITIAFSIFEKKNPTVAKRIFSDAMNMRLGTKNLTISELSIEIGKRGLTFPKLFAMVEKDENVYSHGYSRVCSAFVAAIYKAGGLF